MASTEPNIGPHEGTEVPPVGRRRRRLPSLGVLPTLLTLGNLVAGFSAIHFCTKPSDFNGPWGWSALTVAGSLVLLGMFLDSIDGSVARLTRSVSDLGGQIDSLADLVAFGVAPAFMMLRIATEALGPAVGGPIVGPEADHGASKILWGIAAVYLCCTALRLARFNIETDSGTLGDHLTFRGLPSPGAAGAIIGLILLHEQLTDRGFAGPDWCVQAAGWLPMLIPAITLLCALSMVSAIPYQHTVNRYLRVQRSFAWMAWLVVVVFLAIWWFQATLVTVFVLYAISGPATWLLRLARPGTSVA